VATLSGASLAGGSSARGRVDDDFYATPEEATKALLGVEEILYPALEPACGAGHISKLLDEDRTYSSDLIDRGYGVCGVDFLDTIWDSYSTVITNPPFKLFQEFAEKALEVATKKVIKIQALEGQKRGTFMEMSPLKYVYVFKDRVNPLRNGSSVDDNGKPWRSTMCFAWYVWEQGYEGNTVLKWLEVDDKKDGNMSLVDMLGE